jgi:hypothetical protein
MEITKSSAPLAPLQPVSGFQDSTWNVVQIMQRPTKMVRCNNNDITLEWLEMRDSSLVFSPSGEIFEDMSSEDWVRTHVLTHYTKAIREHEAAEKEVSTTQRKVYMDNADISLLTLAYDRLTKAVKELTAAEEEWKTFGEKI